MNTQITPAIETDLDQVLFLAKSFDLDLNDCLLQQFVVAKKKETIIGFGRLRSYPQCTEVATVGVIPEERNKGIGTAIVRELIRLGPAEVYVTCVIPNFFRTLGFETLKQYPPVLQKKVDFCKLYDFSDEHIFVMKLEK